MIKYIRMSPRKVRYVIDPLRQKTVAEALRLLLGINRRAADPVRQAIASAFANARQKDATLNETQLVITHLTADGGPMWKRFRPAAFGRAAPFRKRTSHIIVELDRSNGARHPTPPSAAATAQRKAPLVKAQAAGAAVKRSAVKAKPKVITGKLAKK
jgi:large subunit ribosomal protein L22